MLGSAANTEGNLSPTLNICFVHMLNLAFGSIPVGKYFLHHIIVTLIYNFFLHPVPYYLSGLSLIKSDTCGCFQTLTVTLFSL